MKTFFKWLLLTPLAAAVAAFAMLNRPETQVVLFPLGFGPWSAGPVTIDYPEGLHIAAPLFAVILASVAIGVVIGGLVTWIGQGKHRRSARAARAESARLLADNERLRAQTGAGATGLPALSRTAA